MKRILAVVAAATGLLVGTGQAAAATASDGPAAQALGQAAGSGQTAGALSGASQRRPTNQNISVRVLSPGDNGDVKQANTVAWIGGGECERHRPVGGSDAGRIVRLRERGTQAIGQEADSSQAATALSLATQYGATNTGYPGAGSQLGGQRRRLADEQRRLRPPPEPERHGPGRRPGGRLGHPGDRAGSGQRAGRRSSIEG